MKWNYFKSLRSGGLIRTKLTFNVLVQSLNLKENSKRRLFGHQKGQFSDAALFLGEQGEPKYEAQKSQEFFGGLEKSSSSSSRVLTLGWSEEFMGKVRCLRFYEGRFFALIALCFARKSIINFDEDIRCGRRQM